MIALLSLVIKHERRVRLVFSEPLAGAAFDPTLYQVINTDSKNISPGISAALIVSDSNTNIELVLDADLAKGSTYQVVAENIPAFAGSFTAVGTQETFRFGSPASHSKIEPAVRDRDRLLYGADLIWNGADYQEDPNGDLARIEGKPNVTKALWHSLTTGGLPWDSSWGVDAREYVDSPSAEAAPLRGVIGVQAARDPRVQSVRTTVEVQGSSTFVLIQPTLVSGESSEPVSVEIPSDS